MFAIDHFSVKLNPSWILLYIFKSILRLWRRIVFKFVTQALYVPNNYLLNISMDCFGMTSVSFTMRNALIFRKIVIWWHLSASPWYNSWKDIELSNRLKSDKLHLLLTNKQYNTICSLSATTLIGTRVAPSDNCFHNYNDLKLAVIIYSLSVSVHYIIHFETSDTK